MKKNVVPASYEDELILFYNKYLNLGLGEGYLTELVSRCAKLWSKKRLSKTEDLSKKNLNKFCFNIKDYASLSNLDQDFINFFYCTYLRITSNYGVIIDSFGTIKSFEFDDSTNEIEQNELIKNIGLNIFEFLNKLTPGLDKDEKEEEAENVILQNVLSSKIYKAIYEKIMQEENLMKASLFALANREIIEYEEELKETLDYEKLFVKKAIRSRSRR